MADFTQTISNSIVSFGPAPTTNWGTGTPYTMTWGVSKWGEGTQDLMTAVELLIGNTVTADGGTLSFDVIKVYENSISPTSETTSEGLTDGSGYSYLFVSQTTEAESRNLSTYSSGSAATTTYTSGTAASTTWS